VTLQVDVNSGAARSAVITVAAGGGAAESTLSQAAKAGNRAVSFVVALDNSGKRISTSSIQLQWTAPAAPTSGSAAFTVVYAAGSAAPTPYCRSGTPVSGRVTSSGAGGGGGLLHSLRVRGLQPATLYSFRVCAVDSSGVVSRGTVWRSQTRG
jgi:hypothetical protein